MSDATITINGKKIELTNDEWAVYNNLTEKPKHIDKICKELDYRLSRVSQALGILELRLLIERVGGMRFKKL